MRKTLKRYKKFIKTNEIIELTSTVLPVGSGIAGFGLIASIIASPIGLVLEASSLACGLISIIQSIKTFTKAEKQPQIIKLAMSKLNTINDMVSKVIDDNVIDQTEFRLILNEHEHYIELRNNLRYKAASPALEDLKMIFLEQGKLLGRKEAQKKLQEKLALYIIIIITSESFLVHHMLTNYQDNE